MKGKLTKRAVDATRGGNRDRFLWDADDVGFGLKVTPAGKRVFVYQFWSPELRGVRRRVTLGRYPSLTVDAARALAKQHAGRVAAGEDPARELAEQRLSAKHATVDQLSTQYLAEIRPKKRPRTSESYRAQLRLHIIPAFGAKPVANVSHSDVARLHSALATTPVTANRVVALVSSFMRWCERRGYRPRGSNPAADVEWFPEQSRERFLTVGEVAKLGAALTTAEREGLPPAPELQRKPKSEETRKYTPKSLTPRPANPFAVASIRFLLLSGWREQEALTLRWRDVDFERGLATLPATKTGKSHRPLGSPALALLRGLQRVESSPFVFPGARPEKPLKEIRRVWYSARHAAGLDDVRLHDLRHTVASFAVGSGHSLLLTGALLGHANPSTTKKYAHLSDDARRATADSVSAGIAAALAGNQGARVSPIPKARRTSRRA